MLKKTTKTISKIKSSKDSILSQEDEAITTFKLFGITLYSKSQYFNLVSEDDEESNNSKKITGFATTSNK